MDKRFIQQIGSPKSAQSWHLGRLFLAMASVLSMSTHPALALPSPFQKAKECMSRLFSKKRVPVVTVPRTEWTPGLYYYFVGQDRQIGYQFEAYYLSEKGPVKLEIWIGQNGKPSIRKKVSGGLATRPSNINSVSPEAAPFLPEIQRMIAKHDKTARSVGIGYLGFGALLEIIEFRPSKQLMDSATELSLKQADFPAEVGEPYGEFFVGNAFFKKIDGKFEFQNFTFWIKSQNWLRMAALQGIQRFDIQLTEVYTSIEPSILKPDQLNPRGAIVHLPDNLF